MAVGRRAEITAKDRNALRELVAEATALKFDEDRVGIRVLPGLCSLLRADGAAFYSVQRGASSFELADFGLHARTGDARTVQPKLAEIVRCAGKQLGAVAFRRQERNRPVSLRENVPEEVWQNHPVTRHVLPIAGIASDAWDLRTVLAERDISLGWIGVYGQERFTTRERWLFAGLAPPLRQAMKLERRLDMAALHSACLSVCLEAIPSPAFLVTTLGVPVHTNRAGRDELEKPGSDTRPWLNTLAHRLAAGQRLPAGAMGQPILCNGLPPHYLVVRTSAAPHLAIRLDCVSREWLLTRRQREVLGLLCDGHANKAMAEQLGCSVRTVEQHITALMRKARVDCRTSIVSQVLRG